LLLELAWEGGREEGERSEEREGRVGRRDEMKDRWGREEGGEM
jgi:hypothetical protein